MIANALGGELLPDNSQYTNRMHIKSSSSDKLYVVAQNKSSGDWSCGCPGWIFKKKNQDRTCKHMKTIMPLIAQATAQGKISLQPHPEEIIDVAPEIIADTKKRLASKKKDDPFKTQKAKKKTKKAVLQLVSENTEEEFVAAVTKKAKAPAKSRSRAKVNESIAMLSMNARSLDNIPLPVATKKKYEKRLMKIQAQMEAIIDDLKEEV